MARPKAGICSRPLPIVAMSSASDSVVVVSGAPCTPPVPSLPWHATQVCENSVRPCSRSATRPAGTATGGAVVTRVLGSAEPRGSDCNVPSSANSQTPSERLLPARLVPPA